MSSSAGKGSVRVVALFQAKAGRADDLKAFLLKLRAPTLQESGCLQYELHQNASNPHDIAYIEEWASHLAIDAHLQSAHIQKALPLVEEFLAAPPDIRRYSRVSPND